MNASVPQEVRFSSATVLLPVMDETESLIETVSVLVETCGEDLKEVLFIIADRTTEESQRICASYVQKDPQLFRIRRQTRPFLGGALQDAFEVARGSHIVIMSSDLETDPKVVKALLLQAKETPDHIITASRWAKGGGFQGYSRIKLVLNFVFQKFFSKLYHTPLTDLTFGFRVFPAQVINAIHWEELKHPFVLETLIKPLRLGVPTSELPCLWLARREGRSHNQFATNFRYLLVGLRVRFMPVQQILKPVSPQSVRPQSVRST